MLKRVEQLPTVASKDKISVCVIVFNDVLYHVRAYRLSSLSLRESGIRKALLGR